MRLYSPQALAFLGDAVYELLVRERIVLKANRPVSELHLQAVEQVRASYQSQAYAVIEPLLTEEEAAALKRGPELKLGQAPQKRKCARLPPRHRPGKPVWLPLCAGQAGAHQRAVPGHRDGAGGAASINKKRIAATAKAVMEKSITAFAFGRFIVC